MNMNINTKKIWDEEYLSRRLMTGEKIPSSVSVFIKFLKKEKELRGKEVPFSNLKVLDLGSGEGRVSGCFASLGADVVGIELSSVAYKRALSAYKEFNIEFINDSFGKKLNFKNNSFDIVLDVTSSNSLNEAERNIYLSEVNRVLSYDGWFFVRGLCKDGDKNAKYLLKNFPGEQYGTYILPGMNLQERVFSINEFKELYGKYFNIVKLLTETHYTKFGSNVYKRKFFVSYMQRRKI